MGNGSLDCRGTGPYYPFRRQAFLGALFPFEFRIRHVRGWGRASACIFATAERASGHGGHWWGGSCILPTGAQDARPQQQSRLRHRCATAARTPLHRRHPRPRPRRDLVRRSDITRRGDAAGAAGVGVGGAACLSRYFLIFAPKLAIVQCG